MGLREEILDSDEDNSSEFSPADVDYHDALNLEQEAPQLIDPEIKDGGPPLPPTIAGSDSTDPSFFERVYNEQLAAGKRYLDGISSSRTQSSPVAVTIARESEGHKKVTSKDSSSLTDSMRGSRKTRAASRNAFITTISTTSGREPRRRGDGGAGGAADVWEVPNSSAPTPENDRMPAPRPQSRVVKTYGKRKRGIHLSPQHEMDSRPIGSASSPVAGRTLNGHDGVGNISRLASRRAKRDTPRKAAKAALSDEPSHMGISPRREEQLLPMRTHIEENLQTSAVQDSGGGNVFKSLYNDPSALAASQKQEHQHIDSSPVHDQHAFESSLPDLTGTAGQARALAKNSCTIPRGMTFSSMITGTGKLGPELDTTPRPKPRVPEKMLSLPYLMSTMTSSSFRRERENTDALLLDFDANIPAAARSAKKKKRSPTLASQDTDSNDDAPLDGWNLADTGRQREHFSTRPSQRGSSRDSATQNYLHVDDTRLAVLPHQEDPSLAETWLMVHEQVSGTVKLNQSVEVPLAPAPAVAEPLEKLSKKRVVKMKLAQAKDLMMIAEQNAAEQSMQSADHAAAIDSQPVRPGKKKRGRSRKSEATRLLEHTAALSHAQDGPSVIGPDAHKQEEKGGSFQTPIEIDEDLPRKQSLGEVPPDLHLAAKYSGAEGPEALIATLGNETVAMEKQEASGKKMKEATKPTAMLDGNIQHRVGLSKRSRIAPLLKCLRK